MRSKAACNNDWLTDHVEAHQKACIDFRLPVIKKNMPNEFLTIAIAKRHYLKVTITPFIKKLSSMQFCM